MEFVFNNFWSEYRPAMAALFRFDMDSFSRHSARLFPTQAKCFFQTYGPSGSLQKLDSLCFLPQNVINEKIFIFLYVWYIILIVFCVASTIYLGLLMTIKWMRSIDLRRMADKHYSRRVQGFFAHYSDYGYWFLLHQFHKNLSHALYQDLMTDLMKGNEWRRSKDEEARAGETKYPHKPPNNFSLSNSTSEEI